SSPTGSLFEDDVEYTATDCENDNPGDAESASDVPDEAPDDPKAVGAEAGELDGCQDLFEQGTVSTLNYGSDTITEDDCPIGASAAAPPEPDTDTDTDTAAAKGAPCTGDGPDATTLVITVEKGKINCSGAVALSKEWLRRAPTQGHGSSGA